MHVMGDIVSYENMLEYAPEQRETDSPYEKNRKKEIKELIMWRERGKQ